MRVLVVDGANVVGSRPDGWWRDRPGAARRLHEALVSTEYGFDETLLVLEGQARRGQAAGMGRGVRTVHAHGSGDDEIVEQVRACRSAGHEVVVVSADRELRARVAAAGGTTVGPTWLRDQGYTRDEGVGGP